MIFKNLAEWPEWESITHYTVIMLYVFIMWKLWKLFNKTEIPVDTLILLTMSLSIGVLIHQNINFRNKRYPKYLMQ